MKYRGFEFYATTHPVGTEEYAAGEIACEIYDVRDEGMSNPLECFRIKEKVDVPVNDCDAVIAFMQGYIDDHYQRLVGLVERLRGMDAILFSPAAQALLQFLREEYVDNGYLYSGSWPYESLKERGYSQEALDELRWVLLVQRRDCEEYAFELSAPERKRLMDEHGLVSVWAKKAGPGLASAIADEINSVTSGHMIDRDVDWGDEVAAKARELREKYLYDDMTTPELALVVEYETEKMKPWVDGLLAEGVSQTNLEERIHDLWLDYQIADGTERALLEYAKELTFDAPKEMLGAVIEDAKGREVGADEVAQEHEFSL